MAEPKPVLWTLFDAGTGKPASPIRSFKRADVARAAARRMTNPYCKYVAVPLFLCEMPESGDG